MALLADTQWSVNRMLIATVAARIGHGGDLERLAAEGWLLLSALDAEHPAAVREVLMYPYVQAWAMSCLGLPQTAGREVDRAHLAGIAAAAAIRAGIEAELALPVRHGSVYLPTVGAFAVPAGTGSSTPVRVSPSGIAASRGVGQWRAVRRLSAEGLSVTVDDIDPFRDCQAWAPARRLTAQDWESWRLGLTAAAALLAGELPAYADVLRAGLRSVVPLRRPMAGKRRSGTARRAFGALAVALPDDADSLSGLLLHEMQHVKLTALCDLCDLFDSADRRRFPVPWRSDRRPIEGVLHGAYAYLAIAELWWSRANRKPTRDVVRRFRTYRSWVETTIEAMLEAGILLPAGERFVEGMRASVKGWADDW